MIQVVQIIALPLSLFCPALQQFSPRPTYPSDSKHNASPSLRLRRNCPAMIWHSPCKITGGRHRECAHQESGHPREILPHVSARPENVCPPSWGGLGLRCCITKHRQRGLLRQNLSIASRSPPHQRTGSAWWAAPTGIHGCKPPSLPFPSLPFPSLPFPSLPFLINRNAHHVRQAPADTKRHLSHHHGERAVALLINEPGARLRSLPRQSRFSALSYPPATPPTD